MPRDATGFLRFLYTRVHAQRRIPDVFRLADDLSEKQSATQKPCNNKYRRRGSNPHMELPIPDFESGASAIPPLRRYLLFLRSYRCGRRLVDANSVRKVPDASGIQNPDTRRQNGCKRTLLGVSRAMGTVDQLLQPARSLQKRHSMPVDARSRQKVPVDVNPANCTCW